MIPSRAPLQWTALSLFVVGCLACQGPAPAPPVPAPVSSAPAPVPAPLANPRVHAERVPPTKYRHAAPLPAPADLAARCGTCHPLPGPELLPKSGWEYLVPRMAENIVTYSLGPAIPAEKTEELMAYFVTNAPEELPKLEVAFEPSTLRFRPDLLGRAPGNVTSATDLPFIANVNIGDLDRDGASDVLICDVQANAVTLARRVGNDWPETLLSPLPAPAHAEPVDVDADGDTDVVVSILGSGFPTDDLVGGVALLINEGAAGFRSLPILQGVARVADAEAADFDGDGDIDFVVAVFGGWTTGHLAWLEQVSALHFTEHRIHVKNGGIHVPVLDLDGDGDMDFIALLSQYHEEVTAFVNDGHGSFTPTILWKAPHPLYGSSGITLADLDADHDLDVVYTNGDAHDMDTEAKPYHGVQWLENRGGLKFDYHEITRLYGAYGSAVGDLDSDGDPDIVVSSQINRWGDGDGQSLIWLENDAKGSFKRHLISRFPPELVTVDVGDLNGDGKADIVSGAMHLKPPSNLITRATLWLQQ